MLIIGKGCMEKREVYEDTVYLLLISFSCKPKTALKIKSIGKKMLHLTSFNLSPFANGRHF